MRLQVSALLLLSLVSGSACVHVFHEDHVEQVRRPASLTDSSVLTTPVRAHLADGTIVVFRDSVRISREWLRGTGTAYALGFSDTTAVSEVALAEVIGVEALREEINAPRTLLTSAVATASVPAALVAIACAADPKCFGSCPTVYTMVAGDTILEAELFSYSIAPLLEGRDVDVIGAAATDGTLRLEVRNEALETHFINHLELLEVVHAPDESVLPGPDELPVIFGPPVEPVAAWAADGRDVLAAVGARDAAAYETSAARLTAAMEGGVLEDHIDMAWPRPAGADTVAVIIRARNSLLTSVLFYDLMLGEAGPRALEWMGGDLQHIGAAVRLGAWWSRRMGLRVSVRDGGAWREVARVADTGPIAWSDVAVPIVPFARGEPGGPAGSDGDSLHVRISFAADQWRIDRIALATGGKPAPVRRVPIARMLDDDEAPDAIGLAALVAADEAYVETTMGTVFVAEFEPGPVPDGAARTLLLASQGFYNEWIRPAWIRRQPRGVAFEASDASLREAMRLWLPIRPDFEARFMATRIPVR